MDIIIIRKLNDRILFTCKNLFGLIYKRLKYAEFGKSMLLTFSIPMPKVVEVIP